MSFENELTVSERLIWMGQHLDPDAPLYNMALAFHLSGAVDVGAFREAFGQLVARTDALRTVFVDGGGRPRREILDAVPGGVEHLHLPELELDDAEVDALLEARTQRVFPLDAPLFDSCLIERRPDLFIWYLNQHHLITDAWSVGVLYRRLAAFYGEALARRAGVSADAESDRTFPQFAAYAEHERGLRDSPRLMRALEHWDRVGGEAPHALRLYGSELPGSGRTKRVRVRLNAERAAALRAIASTPPFRALSREQSHFQVFATLLLAWLHRVSASRDVAIGCPWHNRSNAARRDTAGLLIELFPLRVRIEQGESFASLGAKVAAATMEMMRHVVPGASAAPGARRFDVVLNYITAANLHDFAGLPSRADWIHSGFGDRDHRVRLQVHDFDLAGDPVIDFDLDETTFGDREREWAVRHFFAVFDALIRDPTEAIQAVDLTNREEAASFAPPGQPIAAPASVVTMFHARARSAPEAVAIIDGDRCITYRELAIRAHDLGELLDRSGVGPESVVGLCLDRSADLVVAMLAVLEAGGAFLPLEPAYPDRRLGSLVADAGATRVITNPPHEARVHAWGAEALLVPSRGSVAVMRELDTVAEPDPGALAYVLYTSGSTGHPKGVEVTHRALADYVAWAARTYTDGEALRFALFTSPAFDLTLTSIFTPLVSGGSIVVYPNEPGGGGLLVRRVFEENRVDVVKLTPSHLALVRDLDLSGSRVRRLIVGGEDLKRSSALAIHDAFGGRVEILNEYGPTEATVGCMIHRFDPDADAADSVPIGRPADNARIHVLDALGHPCVRGVDGEIWVGGPRVARGYRGRPDLTAAAFRPDPQAPGERLYRTGDFGRWTPERTLQFLGRRDDQVKVRGARVELGDVESALSRHPEVIACAAHVSRPHIDEASIGCRRCGLQAAHPEAQLDGEGVCAICRRFEADRENVARYFGSMGDLRRILAEARADAPSAPHDCLMLYSGGKDSTYALCRIVELGARPLVFMFDNGFISDEAKANVRRVVDMLGLELVIGETEAMPAIFAESLARFSNVCNGCFKTIYTLAMQLAMSRGIRHIITGLSRGQIFETRLADLYRRGIYDPDEVDRIILRARKAYHRMDDAVSRGLDVSMFENDEVLDRMRFIDFYRYCDDTLDEMLEYVARRTPWIRPSDTGRSTNCLINQAGIFVHLTERGFHNYAMPYSWDVRLGHKRRDAAVAELDDALDPAAIRTMLDRVGYRERPSPPTDSRLVAYYTAEREIPAAELRRFLEESLPAEAVPSTFVRLDRLPLAASGKVDRSALPKPDVHRPVLRSDVVAPRTPVEALLVDAWTEVLGLHPIGVQDDFFELGGDSMQCIQIVSAARVRGLSFAPRDVFAHPTIAQLALIARRETTAAPASARATEQELSELLADFGD